jgi:hypothetical protein
VERVGPLQKSGHHLITAGQILGCSTLADLHPHATGSRT